MSYVFLIFSLDSSKVDPQKTGDYDPIFRDYQWSIGYLTGA